MSSKQFRPQMAAFLAEDDSRECSPPHVREDRAEAGPTLNMRPQTSTRDPSIPSHSHSRLLALPAELRHEIYSYLIEPEPHYCLCAPPTQKDYHEKHKDDWFRRELDMPPVWGLPLVVPDPDPSFSAAEQRSALYEWWANAHECDMGKPYSVLPLLRSCRAVARDAADLWRRREVHVTFRRKGQLMRWLAAVGAAEAARVVRFKMMPFNNGCNDRRARKCLEDIVLTALRREGVLIPTGTLRMHSREVEI